MPEFLKSALGNGQNSAPLDVVVRLLVALLLGGLVAWTYRRTRQNSEVAPSFPVTLVLLSVLIAMVTQVIGDNVARAFSLVGALSIVRFRTVVRDTQDTAYVIFAVVVGMAVGAKNLWVAVIGLGVVALAAFVMMARTGVFPKPSPAYRLQLRVALGHDLERLLGVSFEVHLQERKLVAMETARQGGAFDVTYQVRLRRGSSVDDLVKAVSRLEGVQKVQLEQLGWDEN